MPKHSDAYEEVKLYWFDVLESYSSDMAATETLKQAQAVERNYLHAELAFLDATASGLKKNDPTVAQTLADLKKANEDVKAARKKANRISTLLNRLTSASSAARKLVEAAA